MEMWAFGRVALLGTAPGRTAASTSALTPSARLLPHRWSLSYSCATLVSPGPYPIRTTHLCSGQSTFNFQLSPFNFSTLNAYSSLQSRRACIDIQSTPTRPPPTR